MSRKLITGGQPNRFLGPQKQVLGSPSVSATERPGPALELTQLLPEAKTTTVGELVTSLDLGSSAPADRPYVVVNFVATADGRTAFHGRSGQLGDLGDRAVFHGLRESV